MKVLKFGGSSVSDASRIQHVAQIVKDYRDQGEHFAVVVSAMGGMTDYLLQMSQMAAAGDNAYKGHLRQFSENHRAVVNALITSETQKPKVWQFLIDREEELTNLLHGVYLTRDLSKRTQDIILSFGERSSAYLLSQVLCAMDTAAQFTDARTLLLTDDSYGSAKVFLEESNALIKAYFETHADKVCVVTGFIASNKEGITTTLGRGGSDYTASLLGGALHVEEIQIWTDVDGVMTADPRKVKQAFTVSSMSYEEALEMSHFGARVIYPPTIIPALEKRIPVRIKNSFNLQAEGTLISSNPEPYHTIVKGISSIPEVSLLTLEGSALFGASSISARLFNVLSQKQINAILITQGSSEHAISLAIKPEDASKAIAGLNEEFALELRAKLIAPILIEHELSVIAAIADNMKAQPGISGKFFQALGKNGINIIATAQGSSERNISVVIRRQDEAKALTAVHDVFFLSNYYTLNLFIVGVGLVGGTLIRQIEENKAFLLQNQFVELRIVALANTKQMVFNPEGVDLSQWKTELAEKGETSNLKAFVHQMIDMNLPNSVFLDNTADEAPIQFYPEILQNAISISTPNKVAVSGTFEQYKHLKDLADFNHVKFFYETNVGAGLPVLTTLNDLINSGDRMLRIEGVLSGSLSFIFNSFKAGVSFSEVVKEAQARGYTEPDPRVDLSGKDVARKLLILARESGLALEPEDIEVEMILPQACLDAPDVPSFMEELAKHDDHFEQLRQAAESEGKALRYIATLEGEKAYISLQSLDSTSPFCGLSGSDNMIVITSVRYQDRPLVIKGPGAGAEVTAAGVFAEILRIGYYLS